MLPPKSRRYHLHRPRISHAHLFPCARITYSSSRSFCLCMRRASSFPEGNDRTSVFLQLLVFLSHFWLLLFQRQHRSRHGKDWNFTLRATLQPITELRNESYSLQSAAVKHPTKTMPNDTTLQPPNPGRNCIKRATQFPGSLPKGHAFQGRYMAFIIVVARSRPFLVFLIFLERVRLQYFSVFQEQRNGKNMHYFLIFLSYIKKDIDSTLVYLKILFCSDSVASPGFFNRIYVTRTYQQLPIIRTSTFAHINPSGKNQGKK